MVVYFLIFPTKNCPIPLKNIPLARAAVKRKSTKPTKKNFGWFCALIFSCFGGIFLF
jgi:hypothetical protein